jgi:predicted MFS family arabinose efflux permease
VPESPIKTPSRLDVPGAVLLSGGLVSLLLALTEGESWGWTGARTLGLLVAAAIAFALWIWIEWRQDEPMIDMHMLTRRPVLFANITAVIAGFAMFGSFVLIPNFVETPRGLPESLARLVDYGFGASSTKAGLYLLPGALMGFVAGPTAGMMAKRWGAKWPLSLGMALGAAGIGFLALFHGEPWHIVVGMLMLGSGLPFTFAAMATLIVHAVRPHETGVASGMNTVMRTVGGVIGGQIGAVLLTANTIGRTNVPAEAGFVEAFRLGAAAALVGAAVAVFITSGRAQRRTLELAEAAD